MINRLSALWFLLAALERYAFGLNTGHRLNLRQAPDNISTCGYLNGDPSEIRTANAGFQCAYDATYAIWGFCTTTVQNVNAANCGLMGRCTDSYFCTAGCGRPILSGGLDPYSTIVCAGTATCSSDILNLANQQYTLIGCGNSQGATYYALPTTVSATTTSSSPSSTASQSSTLTPTVSPGSTAAAPSSTAAAPSSTGTGGGTVSTGVIAGTVVGSVLGATALICLTVVVIFILRKRSTKNADLSPPTNSALGYDNTCDEKFGGVETRFDYGQSIYGTTPVELEAGHVELEAGQSVRSPLEMGVSSPR